MAPTLDDLPNELFEYVVQQLDIPNDLLLFLQRTAPRHIDLKSVTFKHGSWQRIFEHIAGRQTGVESVVLRELTNTLPGEHVWLPQAPTHPDFSVEGGIGDNTLELRGDAHVSTTQSVEWKELVGALCIMAPYLHQHGYAELPGLVTVPL
ncbi:hypothetical protein Q7P35_010638 [Cladosporium inversicolor]